MKRYLTLFATILLTFPCVAQESLITYPELIFNSALEKKVFDDHFINNETDLFMFFMANGTLLKEASVAEAKKRFYDHLDKINDEKFSSKKNEKKVKVVFDDLHTTFLNKYELKNKYEEIFYNGFFNCVSASALYGLAFDHLKIPFSVKEKPTHVYLMAYPNAERIIVESTTPLSGYLTINPQFKQNYVKVLREQKIISSQEYTARTADDLFDKYYFGDHEDISMLQLAGVQYLNEGLYLLEEEKNIESMHQLEKAYMLYPSERIAYMMMVAAQESFKTHQARDSVQAFCLAKLSRFKKFGITDEMIQGEFERVVQDLLVNKGDEKKLKTYYNILYRCISSEQLQNEIKFIYNYENGRILYNQARFKESIPFFEECLKTKPKHQDGNRIFIEAVAMSAKNESNLEIIKMLQNYSTLYPLLLENNFFNQMLGNTYLIEIDLNFKVNRPSEGEKYQTLFESFYKDHKDASYNQNLIGHAYSAAAVYYFRKGQTSKAKSAISKGLELSPENYELVVRKGMIR